MTRSAGVLHSRVIELNEVFRIVREIAVHLKYELIVALQCPTESMDVGRAQPQFPFPFLNEDAVGVQLHLLLDQRSRAIGRTIVHDQQVERLGEAHHGVHHALHVLTFVVGGNNDEAVGHRGWIWGG
jgi:hypothetical protein